MGLFDRFKRQQGTETATQVPIEREIRIVTFANTNGGLAEADLNSYLDEFGSVDLFILLGNVGVMDMLKASWHRLWRDGAAIGVPINKQDEGTFFTDGSVKSLVKESCVVDGVRFGGYSGAFCSWVPECNVLLATEWSSEVEEFAAHNEPMAVIVGNVNNDGVIGKTRIFGGYGVNRFVITGDGVERF